MHNAAFYALLTAPDLISRPEMDGFSKRLSDRRWIRLSDSPSLSSNTKVSTEEGTDNKRKKNSNAKERSPALAEPKIKLEIKCKDHRKLNLYLILNNVIKTSLF